MKKIGVLILLIGLLAINMASFANAEEHPFLTLKPYIKGGGVDFDSHEPLGTTHKAYMAIGLRAALEAYKLKFGLEVEKWTLAEPVDDDTHIIHDGWTLRGEAYYPFAWRQFTFYPIAGLGYRQYLREPQQGPAFDEMTYGEASLGAGAAYDTEWNILFYLRAVALFPFDVRTDSGIDGLPSPVPDAEVGFDGRLGAKWKRVDLWFFYENQKFSDPSYQFEFWGLALGYAFTF